MGAQRERKVGRGWRRWVGRGRIELVIWVVVLGFAAYRVWPQVGAALGVGAGGERVPGLTVETLDGRVLSLGDLRGRVVLVNFWATWCPPCRYEMPGFQRVYEEKREAGFVVLGLSMDAGGAWVVRRYVEETGITYPVAMATRESVRAFGGIPTLPTSILIDREGRVRHEVRGIFAARTLEAAVERLLAEGVEAAALREER